MKLSEKIYNRVIRPPLKTFTHKITQKSQIQRICELMEVDDLNQNSFLSYKKNFMHLIHVIEESRQLKQNCWSLQNASDNMESHANQLFAVKSITDYVTQEKFVKILEDVKEHSESIQIVKKIAKTAVKENSMKTQTKLRQIWKNFKPDTALNKIENQGWIQIGFQRENPITDFRGSGMLGLYNLLTLSSKKFGKQLFLMSQTKGFEYFFASVSIYLTVLGLNLLEDNLIYFGFQSEDSDELDLLSNEDLQKVALDRFQAIYESLFDQFNSFWVSCDNRSFMQLNNNLKAFRLKTYQSMKKPFQQ